MEFYGAPNLCINWAEMYFDRLCTDVSDSWKQWNWHKPFIERDPTTDQMFSFTKRVTRKWCRSFKKLTWLLMRCFPSTDFCAKAWVLCESFVTLLLGFEPAPTHIWPNFQFCTHHLHLPNALLGWWEFRKKFQKNVLVVANSFLKKIMQVLQNSIWCSY